MLFVGFLSYVKLFNFILYWFRNISRFFLECLVILFRPLLVVRKCSCHDYINHQTFIKVVMINICCALICKLENYLERSISEFIFTEFFIDCNFVFQKHHLSICWKIGISFWCNHPNQRVDRLMDQITVIGGWWLDWFPFRYSHGIAIIFKISYDKERNLVCRETKDYREKNHEWIPLNHFCFILLL